MADFGHDSLDEILRTDGLLDALAAERRIMANDPVDLELIGLLEGWRDDVRRHGHHDVVTEGEAVTALREGLAEALAEYVHECARKDWGFGEGEGLSKADLLDLLDTAFRDLADGFARCVLRGAEFHEPLPRRRGPGKRVPPGGR